MNLLDTIKTNFSNGFFERAMNIQGLPKNYPAWTIKGNDWIGVAVSTEDYIECLEYFSSVRLQSQQNAEINGETYNLLVLMCNDMSLRDEFATICTQFVEPGADGFRRKTLIKSPVSWWKNWKSLLGNSNRETETYSILGELISLYNLYSVNKSASWMGAKSGTQDIVTDNINYEVKSTRSRYGYEVTINSIYQLHNNQNPIELYFCRFEESPNGECIDSILQKLVSLGYLEDELEESLSIKGLEKGCSARKQTYKLIEMKSYSIDANFPAISEASFIGGVIPKNIIKINYTVDLSGLPCTNILEMEQK